jgi:3-oxoacid CoA-transferase B subunit
VLEYPIHADFALIRAERGDRWGNLVYRKAARNFNPIMAMAAKCAIAQVREVVASGTLDPETGGDAGDIREARRGRWHEEVDPGRESRRGSRATSRKGAYVNLGIGQPLSVGNYLPKDREILLQSENGILGMGPKPARARRTPTSSTASKQSVSLVPGGSYFHHGDSFAMMRGGHLDYCVMGAFQVSETGDLANWHTGEPDAIPAVGGAMDLAIGARHVYVMMEHTTKSGESKIVKNAPIRSPGSPASTGSTPTSP